MKKLLLVFQFLTIIPVKQIRDVSDKEMGSATVFFPLVGVMEGVLYVVLAALFLKVFPTELTNGLLVLVMVIVNGGLHLDGLADTFDAIASRGDKEKKLMVMKDSTVGPTGVIAIVLALLLKYLLLNALFFNLSLVTYHLSLFLMPVFSRWVMVTAAFHGEPAREDGLGNVFIKHTGVKEIITATILTLLFSFFALIIVDIQYSIFNIQLLTVLFVLYIFSLIAVRFGNKNFDGMTGDTLGAVHEISTLLFLLTVLLMNSLAIQN